MVDLLCLLPSSNFQEKLSDNIFINVCDVTDGLVVRAGVSVTWTVLSLSGSHEFEPQSGITWGTGTSVLSRTWIKNIFFCLFVCPLICYHSFLNTIKYFFHDFFSSNIYLYCISSWLYLHFGTNLSKFNWLYNMYVLYTTYIYLVHYELFLIVLYFALV